MHTHVNMHIIQNVCAYVYNLQNFWKPTTQDQEKEELKYQEQK